MMRTLDGEAREPAVLRSTSPLCTWLRFVATLCICLLVRHERCWACSYTHEPTFELRTAIIAASDVVVGTLTAVRGPVHVAGPDSAWVLHHADSVVVEVESVLKGGLEPGPLVLKVVVGSMCDDIGPPYFEDAEHMMVFAGERKRMLLALRDPEEGAFYAPQNRPALLDLPEDFDPGDSPLIEYVSYLCQRGDYPLQVEVSGRDTYVAGQPIPVSIHVQNSSDRALSILFPGPSALPDSSSVALWFSINNENPECPTCFSRFVDPVEFREATTASTVTGDLAALYGLAASDHYAVEAYLKIPISASRLYSEFWGKFLRFSVQTSTACERVTWGDVKDRQDLGNDIVHAYR